MNNYEVVIDDSFEAAIKLIELNPVVLDFASSTNPGGNWRGNQTGTQEESLCRRSNLGILLEKRKYPIPRDSLFYIKDVIINKNVNMEPIPNVKIAVIASELKGISSSTEQYLLNRVDELYTTAINNNHGCIILGLWGCGAFCESDDDIIILARIMKTIRKRYEHLIFTSYAINRKKRKFDTFLQNVQ